MPRRLSNIEWSTFLNEVDVDSLHLPAWGGVIEWRGMQVLVFHGASGEWFCTDISDRPEIFAGYPSTENPWVKVAIYSLPREVLQAAAETPAVLASAVKATAQEVGETAGVLTGPLLKNLTVPLIVVGVVGLAFLVREARA